MTTKTTPLLDVTAIRKLAEASTPGLEVQLDEHEQINLYGGDGLWIGMLPHQCVRSIEEQQKLNAEFFCAARPCVIALADALEAALAEVALLRAVVDALPRCEAVADCGPAMRDYDPPGERQLLCDKHQPTDDLYEKYPYREKYLNDLPHAAALRALLAGGAR